MAAHRTLLVSLVSVLVLAVLVTASTPAAAAPAPTPGSGGTAPGVQSGTQTASFSVDTVAVTVTSRFLPARQFAVSKKGDLSQTATASSPHPYADLSVTTVPFGTKPGTEALPVAQQGAAAAYRSQLQSDRQKQGAQLTTGPAASLFGASVTSQVAVLTSTGMGGKPIVVVEWVSEAGNRIWLVRASAQVDAADQSAFVGALSDLRVESSDPSRPTTIATPKPGTTPTAPTSPAPSPPKPSPGQSGRGAGPSDLSAPPPWWSGDCDYNHYAAGSGQGSFRLGATYLGMPTCGPRPIAGGVDVLVNFFPGAWGEYEWECVELVMRYLYQGFGIMPYPGNGNQVVANYQGSALQKIANPTQGVAPQPGDVLSYGPDTTFGHASVVAASNVNSSGNGTITVVEENNSPGGTSTLNVSGWYVQGFETVSGWLHPVAAPSGGAHKPAAVAWGPNRLDVFQRSANNSLGHMAWDGTAWLGAWQSLGGLLTSDPAAVSWGPGRLDVFARGADNGLWHMAWDGTRWVGWEPLGGVITADPEAVSWGQGRLDLFVRGPDSGLWHMAWDGTQWTGWQSLGGLLTSKPSAVAWGPNRLDIVAQGGDEGVWHVGGNGAQWSGWQPLGGLAIGAPQVVAWGPNRLDVFVRGLDSAAWHTAWDGAQWLNGWQPLGGQLTSDPMSVSWGTNRLDVFARGGDLAGWHTAWDGTRWLSGWQPIGGRLTTDAVPVTWGWNRLDVFAQGTDSAVWHTAWDGSSWLSGWQPLSTPT